jgi:hypothetical protein
MDGVEAGLPELPVTTEYHYAETVPVFFGHYWLRGTPVISSDYAACLDFSVAKRGFLTCVCRKLDPAILMVKAAKDRS